MKILRSMDVMVFKKPGAIDAFGLYVLLAFLVLNPFHFIIYNKFVYYRELFALIFLSLSCIRLFSFQKNTRILLVKNSVNKELFLLLFFLLLLLTFAITDQGRNLYGVDYSGASLHLNSVNPSLYVLRNAFIYIPMVVYFTLRGIKENEVQKIAFLTVLVAPISILAFIYHEHLATITTINLLAKREGTGFNYNSYVPYLTFPVISIYYLLSSSANRVIKLISAGVLIILGDYIFLSFSRQSMLFIIFSGLFFILMIKDIPWFSKLLVLAFCLGCNYISMQQLTNNFHNQNLVDRYSLSHKHNADDGSTKLTRIQIAKDGMSLLTQREIITGAGLSSVINSGPHTDYIRWIQRVGIIVMLIGFSPFLLAGWYSLCSAYLVNRNALYLYLCLANGFTLFHSLFGYPREDAYQAPYCFLALAMCLGFRKENSVLASRPVQGNFLSRFKIASMNPIELR